MAARKPATEQNVDQNDETVTASTATDKTGDTVQGETTIATAGDEEQDLASNEVVATSGAAIEQQVAEHYGETKPTMVNGKSVAGKKYDEAKGEWVDDPDAAGDDVRAEDFFDRIGAAFPMEAQRLLIEELALHVGLTAQGTQNLPDNMPTKGKSTASMRTDITGRGAYAGGRGTKGAVAVAPKASDGSASVSS